MFALVEEDDLCEVGEGAEGTGKNPGNGDVSGVLLDVLDLTSRPFSSSVRGLRPVTFGVGGMKSFGGGGRDSVDG